MLCVVQIYRAEKEGKVKVMWGPPFLHFSLCKAQMFGNKSLRKSNYAITFVPLGITAAATASTAFVHNPLLISVDWADFIYWLTASNGWHFELNAKPLID